MDQYILDLKYFEEILNLEIENLILAETKGINFKKTAENLQSVINKILSETKAIINENAEIKSKYDLIFDRSNDGILIVDREGTYLSMNLFASNETGIPVGEMVGKKLWDFQPKKAADEKLKYINEALDKNIKIVQELTFLDKTYQYHFLPIHGGKVCMILIYSPKRQLEKRLMKMERFLNDSQKIANLGSWEWNLKNNQNLWSDHLYQIYGLDQLNTTPSLENFIKIVHPDDVEMVKEFSNYGIVNHKPQRFNFRIIKPDGEIRYIEANEETIFNKKGDAIKVYGTNQDITEKLIAERKLRDQQILLSNAEKISGIGSWSWNIHTNVFTWSDNLIKIYELDENVNYETFDPFAKLIHPEDLEFVRSVLNNFLIDKQHLTWEFRIITNTQVEKVLRAYADVKLNEDGKVESIYGSNQDITDRKKIEKSLTKSERSLKSSQRIAHLGSWEYNIITGEISGSEEVFNIFSIPIDSPNATIEDLFSFIHPEDKEEVSLAINEALAGKKNYNIDHRIIRPSGEIRYVNEQAEILFNKEGAPQIMIGTVLDITERKQAELKVNNLLRESQALNEELIASEEQVRESLHKSLELNDALLLKESQLDEAQRIAKLGRWEYDIINNEITWSDEIFALMMIDPQNGEPDFIEYIEMIYEADRNIFIEAVEGAIKEGKEYSIEIRMIRTDGEIIWTLGKGKPLRNENGEIIKLIGINADISDRKFAEVSLSESEKLFKAVVQNSSDFVQFVSNEGKLKYVSPSVERILGFTDDEFINMDVVSLLHPDDIEKAISRYYNLLKAPFNTSTIEIRVRHKNGEWVWLESLATNLLDEPSVNAIVTNNRNITDRKIAEEGLVEKEKKYRTLMESASEGILLSDRFANFTDVNTKACTMLGYTEEELLKLNISDLVTKQEVEIRPLRFKELYAGITILTEREFIRKDGSIFYGEISAKMLGENVLQSFIRDVTERKIAAEQLKNQNEELIKINAELDKFVYRASHDLRAPLVSVLGLINIARIEKDQTVKESYYDLMTKSINKLDGFIQSIINFSRNSRVETTSEKIDLLSLIESSLDELKYMQSTHNVVTNISLTGDDFYSDAFRLKLIFNNIISNAYRYSVQGREQAFLNIEIEIKDIEAIFKFIDNGQGIPQESLGRIFEMFYRASGTNAGSGLGLYIVKDVIEALHGKIEVSSIYGKGTTFTITLPNLSKFF